MNTNIKRLTNDAHEVLTAIVEAAEKGDITWGQRDELFKMLATNAEKAKDLLHAWVRQEELVEA